MKHLLAYMKFQLDQWFFWEQPLKWRYIGWLESWSQIIFLRNWKYLHLILERLRNEGGEIETMGNRSREKKVWNGQSVTEKSNCEDSGFHGGWVGKESTCNARDVSSIPGLGRSPGEGNDYPHPCSCLENSMDRGAWRAKVRGIAKSQTRLSGWHWHSGIYGWIKTPGGRGLVLRQYTPVLGCHKETQRLSNIPEITQLEDDGSGIESRRSEATLLLLLKMPL